MVHKDPKTAGNKKKDDDKDQGTDQNKDQNQNLDELLKKAEEEDRGREEGEEKVITRDEELSGYKDQCLRAMAELQNVKKRIELERYDFIKYASANLLSKLLPVLDNFERAFSSLPEDIKDKDWVKGVSQIEKTFVDVLAKEGLSIIDPKSGDEFDHNLHEGIMQDPNQESGKVGQCLEKGYMLKDKVLRHAKVSVGSK